MSALDVFHRQPRFAPVCLGLALGWASACGVATAANAPSAPLTFQSDALPQPMVTQPLDLGAIAGGFESPAPALVHQGRHADAALLIFVSFAMPESTLKRLAEQAERARASLVLHGLVDDSLVQTAARVQRVTAGRNVTFQIDPQAFDRFAIRHVPSFVLVSDGTLPHDCAARQCADATSFARVAGDVSLDYALTALQHNAPRLAKAADRFLQPLRSVR